MQDDKSGKDKIGTLQDGASAESEANTTAVALVNQSKLVDYLKTIADNRKQEEVDKAKKEERIKKRMQLLSQRLLKEAAERKLMGREDTRRAVASSVAENPKKKRISSKPKAEIVESSSGVIVEIEGAVNVAQEAKPSKKPAPLPRVASLSNYGRKKVESDSDSDTDDSRDDDNSQVQVKKKEAKSPMKGRKGVAESTLSSATYSSNYQARDFADWKRKNSVPQDTKVFCMTGWYPCVKQALLDRGWHFNPEGDSPFADLKWTLKSVDVNQVSDSRSLHSIFTVVLITLLFITGDGVGCVCHISLLSANCCCL